MKIFREIFGRICAAWAALFFVFTLLLVYVPFLVFSYYLNDPKKTRRFAAISRVWMGIYLPLIGCPLIVRGRKNFAKGENYIVVSNHN
jgi:1-acyl-sn-glycerol-3-phosphate acyltransferase